MLKNPNRTPEQAKEELIHKIQQAQVYVDFSDSELWGEIKNRIMAISEEAKNAWYCCRIDDKNDHEVVRDMIAQRATVITCSQIIQIVERYKDEIDVLQESLNRIESAEKGICKKGGQNVV